MELVGWVERKRNTPGIAARLWWASLRSTHPAVPLLRIQITEICGQPPGDEHGGPPGHCHRHEDVAAPGNGALGFPLHTLAAEHVEIEPRHHQAAAYQRKLDDESPVGEIFRRLGHPQR